jgi:hypothetical protein
MAKKVKVLIRGGMGNQMFQLAFAIALCKRLDAQYELLDLSSKARVQRNWGLSCFDIEPCKLNNVARLLLLAKVWLCRKWFKLFRRYFFNVLIETNEFAQSKSIRFVPNIISGYWQRFEYFSNIDCEIKEAFRFPKIPKEYDINSDIDPLLPKIAIHVRRGDYASDPIAKMHHLICTPEWYEKAWQKMQKQIGVCQAIIFSDDINWVRKNILLEGKVIFAESHSAMPEWIDMARMSNCDHFIISNSTFSWWAAWLSKADNKKIIAPSFWFKGEATKDLGICPSTWMLL